jgi:hypothetical protein
LSAATAGTALSSFTTLADGNHLDFGCQTDALSQSLVRAVRVWKNAFRWIVDRHQAEKQFVTLVARLSERNDAFLDFHVFHQIKQSRRFRIRLNDAWLKQGRRLRDLSRLADTVGLVLRRLRAQFYGYAFAACTD